MKISKELRIFVSSAGGCIDIDISRGPNSLGSLTEGVRLSPDKAVKLAAKILKAATGK